MEHLKAIEICATALSLTANFWQRIRVKTKTLITTSLLLLFCAVANAQETMVVVHKWDNSVGFYDSNTGQQLAKFEVGVKPHEIALSADRRLAYVTNYGVNSYTQTEEGGNTISIVDLVGRRKIGEIELGKFHRPHGIERGRSGLLYVTADFPASLLVIDPKQKKIAREIAVGQSLPHMVVITRDERKAYTANSGSGSVTAIDLKMNKAIKHISIGGVPMGLELSHDGRTLYAVNRTGDQLLAIDTVKDEVARKVEIKGQPVRLRLTRDGKHLLVPLIQSGEVAVVETATLREVHRFRAGANAEGVNVDDEGRFGYVSAQGEDKVVKFSLRDWRPALEIKTAARPDPMFILKTRGQGGRRE
jgi:YVTN family beta-propeller protein